MAAVTSSENALLWSNDQGPVPRKSPKLFGPVKPWRNLEPFDYRTILFTYS